MDEMSYVVGLHEQCKTFVFHQLRQIAKNQNRLQCFDLFFKGHEIDPKKPLDPNLFNEIVEEHENKLFAVGKLFVIDQDNRDKKEDTPLRYSS